MSSINNDVLLSIVGNMTTAPPADQLIAPSYKAIKELTQAEFEDLLHKALIQARQTANDSKIADPQTMLAILAMYGIQEVHSLGFRPPSAIRAMGIKAFSEERATKGCLHQAKRELIAAAKERTKNEKAAKTKEETKEGQTNDDDVEA